MINGVILQIVQATGSVADTAKPVLTIIPETVKHQLITLSFWDLAVKGGPVMIPIALLSVLAVYIFIERLIIIRRASGEDAVFMNNIRDLCITAGWTPPCPFAATTPRPWPAWSKKA